LRATQNRGVWLSSLYKVLTKTMYTTHHMCVSAASISLRKQMTPETANWKTEETGAADSVSQGIPLSLRCSRSNSTYNGEIDIKNTMAWKIRAVLFSLCGKTLVHVKGCWRYKFSGMLSRIEWQIETIFSTGLRITLYSCRFAWRSAAQISPLFQFAVSRCPRGVVQCIVVNISI